MDLMQQCQIWNENDEYQKIVDAIEALPQTERTPELDSELARACNNLAGMEDRELYKKAIRLLKPHEEYFEGDHNWNFRIAYAYYYLDQEGPALHYFEQALEARPDDEDTLEFIEDCRKRLALPRFAKSFRERTQECWAAFERQEKELRRLMDFKDQEEAGEQLIGKCNELLSIAFEDVAFELGFNGEKYELILTPEGDQAKLFELVYFKRHAPLSLSESWNILVGRQPSQGFELRSFGLDISAQDVQVWVERQEGGRISLNLYCEKFLSLLGEEEGKAWWMLSNLTDQVLGEIPAMAIIEDFEVVDVPGEGTAIPLAELPHALEGMGLKLNQDPEAYLENSYTAYEMEPKQDPDAAWRMDVFTGVTRCAPLINEYYQGSSDVMDAFYRDGAAAGFFCYPLDAFNDAEERGKAVLDFRDELEEAVLEQAGADAVTFLGGATGIYCGYLDFIAWDIQTVLDAAVEIFEKSPLAWADFHAFRGDVGTIRLMDQSEEDTDTASHFKGFDFTGFWDTCSYAQEYVSAPPNDELIADIEQELGYKLPASYIWLMKRQNGGVPVNTCFPTLTSTSWAEDHVAISGIFGIGREKNYSLCGGLGSRFMIEEWGYPEIGVAICDCPSAGHDMIFLDYRSCGPQGEPGVVHIDQEDDYKITHLADSFEEFIRGLVSEEEFEEDEEDRMEEELSEVFDAPFSPLLFALCQNSSDPDAVNQWIRDIAADIVREKGFFALHDDELSYLLYDIQFWLYEHTNPEVTETAYLEAYPRMIALADGFSTGGYSPDFVIGWLEARKREGVILKKDNELSMSEAAKAGLEERLMEAASGLPLDLTQRIHCWHEQNRHRQIVESILTRKSEDRNDDMLGHLAAAYNNLNEFDRAIEVLEELRPRQDNNPKFYYRLGYACYYMAQEAEDEEQKRTLLTSARSAFTRALMMEMPKDMEDCREFLKWITEEYKETQEYRAEKEECAGLEPEMYTEEEMAAVETHIQTYFGKFENVWHELISPDIHVDICVIPPTKERDYYTLVTMGMGAHVMNVPVELKEMELERAELVIALPSDWKLGEEGEQWYWPVRLLKMLARLPGGCDTWLAWGHTVDYQKPYADNTGLCASLLISPQRVEEDGEVCTLPGGEKVNFYQVIPLYRDEMEYKMEHSADELLDKMEGVSFVVWPDRPDALA